MDIIKIIKVLFFLLVLVVVESCNTNKAVNNVSKKDYSRTEVDYDHEDKKNNSDNRSNLTYVGVNDIKKQLGGEWNIITVNGKKVTAQDRAYLNFDFKTHRLYGNNGCNYVNGDFNAEANKVSLGNLITTMMACQATSERAVMKALGEVVSFKLLEKNKITFLHLINAKGHTVMTLRRQNLDFVNGAWTVKEIHGSSTIDKNVRLVIDTEQQKIHGSTGCNIVNGDIYIDTTKDRAIQFQQLVSTRKMCADMKTETALLVALEETYFCEKTSSSEIKLIDEKGDVVVVLTRLDLSLE